MLIIKLEGSIVKSGFENINNFLFVPLSLDRLYINKKF